MKYKIAFFHIFSATLKIPDNLPRYKKNAFTIFHQLLSQIDELNMEVNHRKIQLASLFTSIQQVETEIHKEQETAKQHNCDKALFNLRKARFMKQMQNLTKKLKEQTVLTHSYPMPKPTNATELTKKLTDDYPDEVLIPDIKKDLQEEIARLGLNITSQTNTNSRTIEETLEETPWYKLSASSSSTSTQPESMAIVSTKNPTCEHKDVEQCEPAHEYEDTKQLPPQKSSHSKEIKNFEVPQLSNHPENKTEDTDKVNNVHAKQLPRETSNESPSDNFLDSPTAMKPLKLSHNDHIEAYP